MPISTPIETYGRMIQYGLKKVNLSLIQLILQSVSGGMWVGIVGHCCTVISSYFNESGVPYHTGISKLVYGLLFPTALQCIVFTGSELFTGNTVTMMMCWLDKKATQWQMWKVWGISLLFNFVGAFVVAGFSFLTGAFNDGHPREYLAHMAEGKVGHGWGEVLILGIGCNMLVTFAVWNIVVVDDGAAKMLVMWPPIVVFAVGGYEHIVANFYTLSLALFARIPNVTIYDAVIKNWLPVLLGNSIAGHLVVALLWWYNFHPPSTPTDLVSNKDLLYVMASRIIKEDEAAPDLHTSLAEPREMAAAISRLRSTDVQLSTPRSNTRPLSA